MIFFSIFVLLSPCNAEVTFCDSFEYEDSPLDHGWSGNGDSFFITDEHSKFGNKSLKGHVLSKEHKRIFLWYHFKDNEFGNPIKKDDIILLKLSFYDNYTEPNKISRFLRKNFGNLYRKFFEKHGTENNKTSQFTISFDFYDQYQKILTISNSEKSYSYYKISGWEKIKLRTIGWHEIEVRIQSNMLSLLFDGNLIENNMHKVSKIESFLWSSNIIAPNNEVYSWIDDVEFTRK